MAKAQHKKMISIVEKIDEIGEFVSLMGEPHRSTPQQQGSPAKAV